MRAMKLLTLIFISMVLTFEVHASRILQHADASNGHITIEEIAGAWGVTHKWYVFHFGGTPVAIRSQVQSWANSRRDHYRVQDSQWNLKFRWYFVVKNASGEILDSGFLHDNAQIVWDSNAQFLSPADHGLIESFDNIRGLNILLLNRSENNRRELAQRWVNTHRRNIIAESGGAWRWQHGQTILLRDRDTGYVTDIGFFNNEWDSGTSSDLTTPIIWLE